MEERKLASDVALKSVEVSSDVERAIFDLESNFLTSESPEASSINMSDAADFPLQLSVGWNATPNQLLRATCIISTCGREKAGDLEGRPQGHVSVHRGKSERVR